MPEGDTILRAARTLNGALAGKRIERFETVLPRLARVDDQSPLTGRTIESVRAAGKNLIMTFSGDMHLHTHMRMNGSWHIYRPGERWQKGRHHMRIVIATQDFVAVAFNVPVAEFHSGRDLARQEDLRRIGPDVLGQSFDIPETIRRLRARNHVEIANALLNQRVVAGIGNIFKSESLFAAGVNPFALVGSLCDDVLRTILEHARDLMSRNVTGFRNERRTTRTVDSKPLSVYGRRGEPCLECGTPIERGAQGADARLTYWCPKCQR